MSLKESVNDKYYDNFKGFFGVAGEYPSLKLYIHFLDDIKSTRSPKNLCASFICDVNQFNGSKTMAQHIAAFPALVTTAGTSTAETTQAAISTTAVDNVPFDMAVAIHDIYSKIVPDQQINRGHPLWEPINKALKYVHTLNTSSGSSVDTQKAATFREIVNDHIKEVKDMHGNTIPNLLLPNVYDKIESFKWNTRGDLGYTFGATINLALLENYMDTQTTHPDYKFYNSIKMTHYHLNTHEANQIILNHKAKQQPNNKPSDPSHWVTKKTSAKSTVGYYRKQEDPSKLYKLVKDATGKMVETDVQVGSKYYREESVKGCNVVNAVGDVLVTPGTAAAPGFTEGSCSKFVLACLNDAAPGVANEVCRDFLKSKDYWAIVKNEVYEDMLPSTAVFILEKFGFAKTRVSHGTYKNLHAFVETKVWLEGIKSSVKDPTEFKNISENANLMTYLGMLVNKVNNSPAILNTNYYDKPNTASISNQRLLNTRLGRIGLLPRNILNKYSVPVDMIKNVLNSNIASYRQQLGIGFLPVGLQFGGHVGEQQGGGLGVIMGNAVSLKKRAGQVLPEKGWTSKVERNSKILKDLVEHFTTQLGQINKQISDDDKVKLNSYIQTLEDAEENLLKNIDIMHEYLNVMINYSDEGDSMTEKEALTNIESFLESSGKRINKIEKGSNNLLLTIKKLSDALQVSIDDKVIYP